MARITVGLPFHNAERTLELAVRSVFAQTLPDWEMILVDDGSLDASRAIAEAIDDPRVRVVSDGQNLGLPARLNQIAELATSDYVARMDADDAMHPERLDRLVTYLENSPDVDVIASAAYVFDAEGTVYGIAGTEALATDPRAFVSNKLLMHPTVAFRRTWLLSNPYDVAFIRAQDKELWCRTRGRAILAKLPEPLLFYRQAGTFNFEAYKVNCRLDRRILRTYGLEFLGPVGTARAILASFAKDAIYRLAGVLGFENVIVRGRSRRLAPSQQEEARAALDVIAAVQLPTESLRGPTVATAGPALLKRQTDAVR